MSRKILGKLQTRKTRMIGRNTVARLSSFRRIRPRFLELISVDPFDPANPFVSLGPVKIGDILGEVGVGVGLGPGLITGLQMWKRLKFIFIFLNFFIEHASRERGFVSRQSKWL